MYRINPFQKLKTCFDIVLKKKRDCRGFTLVEVVVAFLIITLVSMVLIQTTLVSTRATEVNKAKTEAMALINSEIEDIRLRDYNDVGIIGATGSDPEGSLEQQSVIGDYTITRDVSWVEGEYSYKQVEIKASGDKLSSDIIVITQIFSGFGLGGAPLETYPPPANLIIEYDFGWWFFRAVGLNWDAPETETVIDYYKIYRDDSHVGNSNITRYVDWPGNTRNYTYYVTVVYQDGTESDKSNEVRTTR